MQTTDKRNFLRAEAELALEDARKAKAERTKDIGSPIKLPGLALDLHIEDNYAWIAENTGVIRTVDLETSKTLQIFKGHTAPVTSIAFYNRVHDSVSHKFVISGSWDKTIKVWDIETKKVYSTTEAHADFIKALLVIPSLNLLVSSSSDKIVRFWDLSSLQEGTPLQSAGSISAHTRPVESLAARTVSETSAILYTGDTMGIIKVWQLDKEEGPSPRWKTIQKSDLKYHRTKIHEILYGNGQLWSASADETVKIHDDPPIERPAGSKPPAPITHPTAVRSILPLALTSLAEPYVLTGSGEVIRAYDVSSPDAPELLGEVDAHWHDVTALRLWMKKTKIETEEGKTKVEPWIVSASLDGTLRKWRLLDLLQPTSTPVAVAESAVSEVPEPAKPPHSEKAENPYGISEEEERELAELMDSD